jgi:predicted nucleic acid-binding protein
MHTVLVDTSVWVDHLRKGETLLQDLLSTGQVATHPCIIGELACGNLTNHTEVLKLLSELPLAAIASNDEVMHLIEKHDLGGKGIGWIDAHLLASALLDHIPLWTRDRRLAVIARTLGISGSK